jgi:tRNA(Ile)-lysidine synthase
VGNVTSFLRKVHQTITRFKLLGRGERILIGVSGGADSMALLHALAEIRHEWGISLMVAYLDHGLRREAAEERVFVGKAAADLGLPFVAGKADVGALKRERRLPLQEAAREARYTFLMKAARDAQSDKIALGHTADDQAESVLMRILRGSGARGLSGIPPKRGEIFIRPLIAVGRGEIESYLRQKNISYRDDVSNRNLHFLRNRIRRELLPELEKYNPQIRRILVQMADHFRMEEEYWRTWVQERLSTGGHDPGKGILILDIPGLAGLPIPLRLRLFRGAIEKILGHLRGFGFSHFWAIENLWQNPAPNKEIRLPNGIRVFKSYEVLKISFEGEKIGSFEFAVPGPGIVELRETKERMRFSILKKAEVKISKRAEDSSRIAFLEYDRLHFPLTVRSFRAGDKFQPLGMEGGKKVKDFFMDRKIPLVERRKIPLLFSDDKLLWVGGLRIDHRFRVKPTTRQVLRVEIL